MPGSGEVSLCSSNQTQKDPGPQARGRLGAGAGYPQAVVDSNEGPVTGELSVPVT